MSKKTSSLYCYFHNYSLGEAGTIDWTDIHNPNATGGRACGQQQQSQLVRYIMTNIIWSQVLSYCCKMEATTTFRNQIQKNEELRRRHNNFSVLSQQSLVQVIAICKSHSWIKHKLHWKCWVITCHKHLNLQFFDDKFNSQFTHHAVLATYHDIKKR